MNTSLPPDPYTPEELDEIESKARRGFALSPDETIKMVWTVRYMVRLGKWVETGPMHIHPIDLSRFRDTVVHEPGHVPTKCEEDGA